VQDCGEAGVSGIKVMLKGAGKDGLFGTADDTTATTTTAANGAYLFANLDAGKYQLAFSNTTAYAATKQNQGSNDAADSDIDANGTTGVITLGAGEQNLTVDAGLYQKSTSLGKDAGITPIVINLDGHGIQTISRDDSAGSFDLLGTGHGVSSGWIANGSGFLAVDKSGNGKIDDITELFGGNAKGAGFAQLASYDSNSDGVVDAKDADFNKLLIWQDVNGNHGSDASELMTLAQAGIASLTVGYTELPFIDAQGNLQLERSSATLSSGTSVSMTDVYFNVSADDAKAAGVALPSMADLLGSNTLDTVVGAGSVCTLSPVRTEQTGNDGAAAGHSGDASEALRRMAQLTHDEGHQSAA
jgi:hypothetical protein